MDIRLFQFIESTAVEGPGNRACIQVQGCPVCCPGCALPQTWSAEGGQVVSADSLVDRIMSGPTVEGVTFLGGEPFSQAAALAYVARSLRRHGLSVLTFTGHLREELEAANRADYDELLAVTDLLIDGPFQRDQVDFSRPWVGSRNQRYHFLTDRYAHLADQLSSIPNRIEVRMKPDGRILINGLAAPADMAGIVRGLV